MRIRSKESIFILGLGLVLSLIMIGGIFIEGLPKRDQQGKIVPTPPVAYPHVDQMRMVLTLKSDETFVSTTSVGNGGGYFQLVTQVAEPSIHLKEFRVYHGQMGEKGVMIQQPYLWYTIKEQR